MLVESEERILATVTLVKFHKFILLLFLIKSFAGGPMMGRTANEKGVSYIYLAGIVSYGAAECGTQDKPGVYSRISEYIPWILDNLEF